MLIRRFKRQLSGKENIKINTIGDDGLDFKVGDKVVMDRKSKFFKEDVVSSSDSKLVWWSELEKMQPLVVKEVKEIYSGLYHVYLEDTDYMVADSWLKLFKESNE